MGMGNKSCIKGHFSKTKSQVSFLRTNGPSSGKIPLIDRVSIHIYIHYFIKDNQAPVEIEPTKL